MTTTLQTTEKQPLFIPEDVSNFALEMAIGMGDFSKFSPADCLRFIGALCSTMKLNALTLPFRIMEIDGRKILYATADCAAQLRARDKMSVTIKEHRVENGCYVTVVFGKLPDGRTDEATGAVPLVYPAQKSEWINGQKRWVTHPQAGKELQGLEWANAVKKSETQAKRRLALSLAGLGIPIEDDIEHMKKAEIVSIENLAGPTMEQRADNLNALALTSGEKEKAVEVLADKPAEQISTPAAVAVSPPAEKLEVKAESSTASDGAGVASSESDAEKMAMELQILFGENKNCVAYCVNQGKLARGKGLETIDREYGERILKNAQAFIRKVEAWVKGGGK